jgi:hypothetical protein
VALVRADDSEERSASILRVTRIGEPASDARCEKSMSSLPIEENYVRFEVFTAVTVKNAVF